MIPQGWQEKTLGEVSIFSRGLTYSKKDEVDISDNIVLRANNIDLISNTLNFDELKYLNKNFIIPEDKKVKKNSILICISSGSKSHLGKVAFIDKDYSYAFGGFMGLITPMQCIFPRFLYYMLISQSFIDFTSNLTDGANINNLKYSDIKDFRLRICPLSEQERIVAKLDKAFEAIDKVKANAEKNLNNAKELFETALNNAFTENTDGWEEKTLGEVSQIISGTTPDTSNPDFWGKGNYWVTPAEINEDNLYIRKTDREITNLAIESCSLRKMPRGTIIFSSRAPIGKIAISDVDTLYCNQGFKNFICSKNIYNKFLYYFLLKNKKYIISLGKGTTFKEVSKGIISAVNIQYPSLPEQHKIVEKLDKLQEQTKQLEAIYTKKIKDLDELKQSILQKAFRGEL